MELNTHKSGSVLILRKGRAGPPLRGVRPSVQPAASNERSCRSWGAAAKRLVARTEKSVYWELVMINISSVATGARL